MSAGTEPRSPRPAPAAELRPEVSIGMPVYNGEPWVALALDSLLAQTFGDFELVIADNASTDGTASICRAAAARDPRVRYSRSERNLGGVRNFNRVLESARGRYFMWAACDDLWEPRFLERLFALLRGSPGAALAFCDFDNIDERGRPLRDYPHLRELPGDAPAARLAHYIAQPEHLGKANLIYGLMPRETLLAAGGLAEWAERDWGADMLVVFRILSLGGLVLAPERLFHKRLVGPAMADVRRGTIASRLGRRRRDLQGWKAYFNGYERLIDMAACLSGPEREELKRIARERYRLVRGASLREMRGGAVASMKSALRQIRSANVLSVRRK